jgi:hypothetical protein
VAAFMKYKDFVKNLCFYLTPRQYSDRVTRQPELREEYMKRLIGGSLVLALIVFAAFTGVASATHSNGVGPGKDFADGTGQGPIATPFGVFPSQQHINGQNTAAGGVGGTGHFLTDIFAGPPFFPPGTVEEIEGTLTCLNSVGNQELDSGVITTSTGPIGLVGVHVIGKHIDNGEPGAGSPADMQGGMLIGPLNLTVCPPPAVVGAPVFPITQGNLVVHDGI